MKWRLLINLLAAASLLAPVMSIADESELLLETRSFANAMPVKLMAVLTDEIAKGGYVSAISVCQIKAPKMAQQASAKTGWDIRRVSLKNRNPNAVPDTWEASVLAEFDQLAAAGKAPATLEKTTTETVNGKKVYRYMKALPTQPLCLNCHGSSGDIPKEVQDKLATLYPEDKATGYKIGEIRGAITIKRELD